MNKGKPLSLCKQVVPLILCGAAALLFTLEGLLRDPGHYDFWIVGDGGTFGLKNLRIFGIRIYDVMLILGAIAAFRAMWSRRKAYALTDRQALLYPLLCLLIGAVGSRVYVMIQQRTLFVQSRSMVGGIYMLVMLLPPLSKHILKRDHWKIYDLFLMAGLSFAIVVRLGCFMNDCCGGRPMVFHGRTVRLPVQLYECFGLLAIRALLLALERQKVPPGHVAMSFAAYYAPFRFLLEYLRSYPTVCLGMTASQILAVAGILIWVILYTRSRTLQKPLRFFPFRKDDEE